MPNAEEVIDFTNSGANTTIPEDLNAYSPGDNPESIGERFFPKRKYNEDGILIEESEFFIYDKDEPAPLGACRNNTLLAADSPIVTFNGVKVKYNTNTISNYKIQ